LHNKADHLIMQRFSKFFWASLALLLILIVSLATWSIYHARATAYNLLREEGEALGEAIERSALHGFRTEALLNQQFLDTFQDQVGKLDDELTAAANTGERGRDRVLRDAVERHHWDRALVLDQQLQVVGSYPPENEPPGPGPPDLDHGPGRQGPMGRGMGMGMGRPGMGRWGRLRAFLESPEPSLVLQGPGWRHLGGMEPYMVALKRRSGEVLVVRASLERMQQAFNPASVETLFRTLVLGKNIVSVVLADEEGTVRIASDPAWTGKPVSQFETSVHRQGDATLIISRALTSDANEPKGSLLLALSTASAQRNLKQTRRGILLMGLATLVIGIAGLTMIASIQRRALQRVTGLQQTVARSQRLAALGQMAAQVAHEIRNPLNAINLTLQNMHRQLRKADSGGASSWESYFDVAQREVKRLNRIVEDFLQVSRFPQLNRRTVNLNEWLQDILALYENQAKAQGLSLEFAAPGQPSAFPIDPDQLRQAVGNLLLNAIQASPSGKTVHITLRTDRQGATLAVRDEGPGIPAADLERVMEPYYTTRAEGSGLGLAIALRIVEEHGGTLQLHSGSNQGTTATIFLPQQH
jgi:signal transduction histidine kinase